MTKQPPREAAIVKQICDYLKTLDKVHFEKRHGTPFGRVGEPDISGCILFNGFERTNISFEYGQRFEIEVKRPGHKPTKRQELALAKWKAAGAAVAIIHSVDECREFIEGL